MAGDLAPAALQGATTTTTTPPTPPPSTLRRLRDTFLTRAGLLGNYDYAFLFRPNLPFLSRWRRRRYAQGRGRGRGQEWDQPQPQPQQVAPFFGLNDRIPVVLALLLGLQHALAMLAGVITPPIILAGSAGLNLDQPSQRYLVSTALITSGILTTVQITRCRIWKTPYYVGTGLLSVVGISFTLIPVGLGAISQMYANGYCPSGADGTRLPCPRGYGALVGTSAVCALLEILLSFAPPRVLLRIFPPIVTGPTVTLIGVHLIQTGFQSWAGGSGTCATAPRGSAAALCPSADAPHALPWGSPQFIGLGFSVYATILLCERLGSPMMRTTSVAIGLLVGCIIAAACGYFDRSGIDSAPVASFIWTRTFPLAVYGPLVLPMLAVYVLVACEAVGDITASCDVSRVAVAGPDYESRIQGGVLADGLNGVLAGLMTMTPMSTFAQNNGVIALTGCASRTAGYVCAGLLVAMGVFAKFAAALVAIPAAVLGGMTTFLFCAVAVSGMAIVARRVPMTRRNRFILTAGLAVGYGATLVPTWFDAVFTYQGGSAGLRALTDAVTLVMETGFAVTAAVCMILDLALEEEEEIGGGGGGGENRTGAEKV